MCERDTSCFWQGACATFQTGFGGTCNWHRGCTAQAHRKVTLYVHSAIQPTGHKQYMASPPPPPSAFALSTRQQIAVDTQSVAIRWQFNTGGAQQTQRQRVFVVHPLGSGLSVDCMQLAQLAGRFPAQRLFGCAVEPLNALLPCQTLAVSTSGPSRCARLVQPNAAPS
jgi:hypothetical protein